MSTKDRIEELKQLPPLTQHVCGTCAFYSRWDGRQCRATSTYAQIAWAHLCGGKYWAPKPPPVPILVRFKRWLIG